MYICVCVCVCLCVKINKSSIPALILSKKKDIPALKGTWCHFPSPYLSMHCLKRLSSSAIYAPFLNRLDEPSMDQL